MFILCKYICREREVYILMVQFITKFEHILKAVRIGKRILCSKEPMVKINGILLDESFMFLNIYIT